MIVANLTLQIHKFFFFLNECNSSLPLLQWWSDVGMMTATCQFLWTNCGQSLWLPDISSYNVIRGKVSGWLISIWNLLHFSPAFLMLNAHLTASEQTIFELFHLCVIQYPVFHHCLTFDQLYSYIFWSDGSSFCFLLSQTEYDFFIFSIQCCIWLSWRHEKTFNQVGFYKSRNIWI